MKIDNETLAKAFNDGITDEAIATINSLIDECDMLYTCEYCKKVFCDNDEDIFIKEERDHLYFCSDSCLELYYEEIENQKQHEKFESRR